MAFRGHGENRAHQIMAAIECITEFESYLHEHPGKINMNKYYLSMHKRVRRIDRNHRKTYERWNCESNQKPSN